MTKIGIDVRRAIQHSEDSVRALASRYGVSPTSVQKWRKRNTSEDSKVGSNGRGSAVLSPETAVLVAAFRRHTALSLDDCLCALRPIIPRLSRSSLHRCFKFNGVNRLLSSENDAIEVSRFKPCPLGCFHLIVAEIVMRDGKQHLYAGIDKKSKLIFAQLHDQADLITAAAFLRYLLDAAPYDPHTIVTNGVVEFPEPRWSCNSLSGRPPIMFDQICRARGVVRRSVDSNAEFVGGHHEQYKCYTYNYNIEVNQVVGARELDAFLNYYNRRCQLKALGGLTPWEYSTRIVAR